MAFDPTSQARLKYRDEFRSHNGGAFQHWFERLAVALHGDDCFLPIRVTRGDGGLDGLVLRQGNVYQLYAPATLGTDAATAAKIRADFSRAEQTLGPSMKAWTFLHNSGDGKVGHLTAQALAQLQDSHPHIHVDALGIDGLWERLAALPAARVADLFNITSPTDGPESKIHFLLKRAGDFDDRGKRREAFGALEEALAIAELDKLAALQAEILVRMCLMSSERARLGDRPHYFDKLKSLKNDITDAKVIILFHRAHAAYLLDQHDTAGAESAYSAAISAATSAHDASDCGAHLCVARSDYAHLLCNADRRDEADEYVRLAEEYGRANADSHDGEVLEAALGAGLHWAATGKDDQACIVRIEALEASARTGYRAARVAGHLVNDANRLSHAGCHRAALAAAEAALRLSNRMPADEREPFLPGVLYTIAMVHFAAGRLEDALSKAAALLNTPQTDKTASIRFAAAQLVSVISRQVGDVVTAVDKAELAVGLAGEVDSSFMAKMNLADSLADQGDTERALETAQQAYQLADGRIDVPKELQMEALAHTAQFAADLGREEVLHPAMAKLQELASGDPALVEKFDKSQKRVEASTEIRKRLLEISLAGERASAIQAELQEVKEFAKFVTETATGQTEDLPAITTLRHANALTIAPVVKWWEDTSDDYNAAALDYDYWGRGCFARVLRNLQAFPHSLNVTIEVRTLDDIRQALRLWALYADFVLLLWKGPTKSGQFMHIVDGEWFGPWGAGYMLALGTKFESRSGRSRYPAIGYASWLPEDVARFLVTEAKPFLANGRALLVPASSVGCVSPGHGVIEQLLTEVANCIPVVRRRRESEIEVGPLPYASDVPLNVLFDFINESETDLLRMRELLISKTAHIRRNGLQPSPKALELEIADSLRRLRAESAALARKRHLLPPVEQATRVEMAPFRLSGRGLLSSQDSAFSPLLTLESMGYGWKIGTSGKGAAPYRYEPAEGEAVGAWLAPPKPGVRILTIKKADESAIDESS